MISLTKYSYRNSIYLAISKQKEDSMYQITHSMSPASMMRTACIPMTPECIQVQRVNFSGFLRQHDSEMNNAVSESGELRGNLCVFSVLLIIT